jgi:Lung seven transmembrane receptor
MDERETGQYVVVFANCHEQGREILVSGSSVWKSEHGYLPGELYGFMYFYTVLAVVYFAVMLWYGISMHLNVESRIPIEKWILITIVVGFVEMIFRSGDYFVWNQDGYRMNVAMYLGILLGVFKRGFSRCLGIMVSLGWGVIRDSLGSTMRWIILLGATYIGVSSARELMWQFAIDDLETLSYGTEEDIFSVTVIMTFVVSALDVIFILWILDALNGTMEYLENMGQTRKLMRYLRLRCIFLFGILFATAWVVFALVDTYDEVGIVEEEHEWVVKAATEINYLFMLLGVAILWRPNPSAKEYAYAMELPATSSFEDEGGTELELTGAVPSAMDDDDDDPSGKKGYHDDRDGRDDRFQIDDAEAT